MDVLKTYQRSKCYLSQIKATLKVFRSSNQLTFFNRDLNQSSRDIKLPEQIKVAVNSIKIERQTHTTSSLILRISKLRLIISHSILGFSRRDMESVHIAGCNLRLFHIVGDHEISKSEKTERVTADAEGLAAVLLKSAACLLKGGVIAVPTDTIYGVACLAQSSEAINRIYEIKNRNFQNPIAISVSTIEDIYKWCKVTVERKLLTELLPGAVTVVFQRSLDLNPCLNPQTSLVGVRIPNHSFMQALAKECDSPIALTSANISGAKSCLKIEEFEHLWPKLDLVVDGGTLSDSEQSRLGSTVVDLSVPETFRIIRSGSALETTLQILEKYGLREMKLDDNTACAR